MCEYQNHHWLKINYCEMIAVQKKLPLMRRTVTRIRAIFDIILIFFLYNVLFRFSDMSSVFTRVLLRYAWYARFSRDLHSITRMLRRSVSSAVRYYGNIRAGNRIGTDIPPGFYFARASFRTDFDEECRPLLWQCWTLNFQSGNPTAQFLMDKAKNIVLYYYAYCPK